MFIHLPFRRRGRLSDVLPDLARCDEMNCHRRHSKTLSEGFHGEVAAAVRPTVTAERDRRIQEPNLANLFIGEFVEAMAFAMIRSALQNAVMRIVSSGSGEQMVR